MLSVQSIFKKINSVSKKTKTPVYIVGGFVRDYLMDVDQKKDLDFVVVGSGLEFAKKFDSAVKKIGSLVEFPEFDTARYVWGEGEKQIILEFAGREAKNTKKVPVSPRWFRPPWKKICPGVILRLTPWR